MPQLEIACPAELLTPIGHTKAALQQLAQEAFLVRLYQLGEISSGRAAEILQMPRREFLDLLGRYGVSVLDEQLDLEAEAGRGR
jgi:predicted HTH domain antitoxin